MRQRYLLGVVASASVAAAFLACVGDAPTLLPDASTDAPTLDAPPMPPSDGGPGDGSAADGGSPCIVPSQCPTAVQPGKLALWLRGDDLDCDTAVSPARVKTWPDRSGAGRNARPRTGALGPRCGSANGEMVKGKTAPAFRPTWGDKDGGAAFDETLDVDLSWLAATDYTLFVVERRGKTDFRTQGVVATDYFTFSGGTEPSLGQCNPDAGQDTSSYVDVVYAVIGAPPLIGGYTHRCGVPPATPGALITDGGLPTTPNVLALRFSTATGRSWFANGTAVGANGDKVPLKLPAVGNPATSGAIGRGHNARTDGRFYGTITEVVGYAAALSEPERQAIEAYLAARWQ